MLAKVALGEADAGFVYATDAKPVAGQGDARSRCPPSAQPKVAYEIAVVKSSRHQRGGPGVRRADRCGKPGAGEAARAPASCRAREVRRGSLARSRSSLAVARRARVPRAAGASRSSRACRRAARRPALEPGRRPTRCVVSLEDDVDRAGARSCCSARRPRTCSRPALPRPRAARHARRAAARAAAGGRRASGCSPRSAGSGCSARRFGAAGHRRSRSRRPRSCSPSRSSPGPLYVRQAIAAFEAVDPNVVAASRTLGAGPARTFFRVALPLARGGLAAGAALALRARARRVRRHDHVRRQPPGRHADAAARDLRGSSTSTSTSRSRSARCSSSSAPPCSSPSRSSCPVAASRRTSPFRFARSSSS